MYIEKNIFNLQKEARSMQLAKSIQK